MYSPCNVIKNAINNNKLSHAYLFYGDNGVDVEKPTLESIKMIINSMGRKIENIDLENSNYFDLKFVKPNKENLIIKDEVDQAIQSLYESSLEQNAIKILYIKNIECGNKHSLNRLLKFIEEPTNNLVIFMNSNHFDEILPTIKSRSQNIYVRRENHEKKINEMKSVEPNLTSLVASIYANIDQLKNINLNLFRQTYSLVINAFEESIKNKFVFKEKIYSIWTKDNNDFILNILQFFFYQLMTKINDKHPLFPNKENLISKYKIKNINCFTIQILIEKTKRDINNYANFNLQKINFLNNLEKELID